MTETFTFDNTLATDLALVRFHIGDIDEAGNYLFDETINGLLTIHGSVGGAVVASIIHIMTQLASPDFELDWMQVSNKNAFKAFEGLLRIKRYEFGISTGVRVVTSIENPFRKDSNQHTTGVRQETDVPDNTSDYEGN